MSKYVDHKHGMVIGSDNYFGIYGVTDDYPVCFWTKNYNLKQVNTVNVYLQTPAQQIIWAKQSNSSKYVLSEYMTKWMERNVGEIKKMWDWHSSGICDSIILFKRRRDAIKLVKFIDSMVSTKGKQFT